MAPKKRKAPGDGDGGMRVDKASDVPRGKPAVAQPEWHNPRDPLPASFVAGTKLTIMDKAIALFPDPKLMDKDLLAAVLVAQALDRLGASIIDAAAVGRYRGT